MSKKLTKALVLALCAVLLVAGSIMGTVAYLTAETSVSNTFTYGNVAITMNDAKTDAYGAVTVPNERTTATTENEYKLIPGRTYTKNTKIYVDAASEDCYLFIKIEYTDPNSKITVDVADNWTTLGNGVYYYNTVATANAEVVAVDGFAVNTNAIATDLQAIDDPMTVTAYAVQRDNFDSASAAWTATFGATPTQP